MPQGVQIFDASGNTILNMQDRITRIIGTAYVTAETGSISVPAFTEGTPFCIVIGSPEVGSFYTTKPPPSATISGTTLSWIDVVTFAYLAYGVY